MAPDGFILISDVQISFCYWDGRMGGDTRPKPTAFFCKPILHLKSQMQPEGTISIPDFQKSLRFRRGHRSQSKYFLCYFILHCDSQMQPEGTISIPDFQKSLRFWEGTPLPNPPLFCVILSYILTLRCNQRAPFRYQILKNLLDFGSGHPKGEIPYG